MSIFPRTLYSSDTSFTPLFRLLDDFDTYRSEVAGTSDGGERGRRGNVVRTFTPKFDVRETDGAYELHGELPGIERDNISIDFTEPQTIVIRGRVERSYTSGTPPAALGQKQGQGAITDGKDSASHKATVEDETEADKAKKSGNQQQHQQVAKQDEHSKNKGSPEKYWVSERSVGEFSRTFSFPSRIDQDNVSANLSNGILTLTVPKAKKHESRRINIKVH